MGAISEEAIACIRTVKAFSTELFETKRYAKRNGEAYRLGKSSGIYNALFTFFIGFMMNGVNALIIYYGAILVKDGAISVGEITAFLLYMIQLLFNFAIIAMVVGNVYKISGASEKIVEMMKTPVTVNASGGMILEEKDVVGEIEIKNVNFHYPTKPSVQVSKDICIKIEKNNVVAFVGTSGCGKSSIISLIERYYDPIEGEILFSGVNIKKFDPKWLKKQIGIVAQEPVLFTGTIRDNICYGLESSEVNDADIDEACKKANAYDFIMDKAKFTEGYDTLIGERGVKLSGGQKQRVAIARALIRKPKVLLLDEATSALDAESEHVVQKALDKLIKEGGQTVIVIAHRLSTIRDADMICVFQNGLIVERGKHQELIEMDGAYKTLIQRQLTNQAGGSSPSKMMSATPVKEKEVEKEKSPVKPIEPAF